jgi:N-terminal domain of anti-restriction factor ArdC
VTSRARTSRREWADQIAARVAAAQELLAAQLAELRSGEDWKRYLTFQARLHRYSPNNATLIHIQHAHAYAAGLVGEPEPSYVAGYGTWKALGRTVERGQHGYAILAPVQGMRRVATDPYGTARLLTRGESPEADETEATRRILRGFKVEYVFDLSQTTGRPIPEPVRPELLAGQAPPGLGTAVVALIRSHGYSVDSVPSAADIDGANGLTNWSSKHVAVRADMGPAAIVKTLVHEAAHVILHESAPGRDLPRQLKEVEAESVAYVVASAHGVATDGYSFPYIATWAGQDLDSALRRTQARVAAAARTIIDASSAPHNTGGRPEVPGAELQVAQALHKTQAAPQLGI